MPGSVNLRGRLPEAPHGHILTQHPCALPRHRGRGEPAPQASLQCPARLGEERGNAAWLGHPWRTALLRGHTPGGQSRHLGTRGFR